MQLTSLVALVLLGVAVYADDARTTTAAAVTAKAGEADSTTVVNTEKTRCTRHHKEGEHKGEHKPNKFSFFHKIVSDVIFESRLIDRLVAKFEHGCKHKESLAKHHAKKDEGDDKNKKIAALQGARKPHGDKKDEGKKVRPAHGEDKKHDELVKLAVETTIAPAAAVKTSAPVVTPVSAAAAAVDPTATASA